jgi:hypothetical protein
MINSAIRVLDRVRRSARWRGGALGSLTVSDMQAVTQMAIDGDLIHVDEVDAYVDRCRKQAYADALVESLRSARDVA